MRLVCPELNPRATQTWGDVASIENRELATVDISAYFEQFYNPARRLTYVGGVTERQEVSGLTWELHLFDLALEVKLTTGSVEM